MIIIYRAANIADAHLMRQLLESEGIPAFIQGEYLQGAVGELPANTEILVRVADDNAEAARAIVDEWEAATPVKFKDDFSETLSGKSSGTVAGGISPREAVLLFLAVVIGGGLAIAWLRNYAES
jgi:hypothetical protein